MKSRIGAAVLILAAVALVGGWVRPVRAQQTSAARWEYCVVGVEVSGSSNNRTISTPVFYYSPQGVRTETVERTSDAPSRPIVIARLGMDGWEMFQVTDTEIYFKRQMR